MYSDDKIMAASLASVCDLLAVQLLEVRAVVQALSEKEVLTISEYLRIKESVSAESGAALASELQRNLQTRIAERLQSMGEDHIH